MNYSKHMNVYQIFNEMLDDVKYIKRTTFLNKVEKKT